MYSSFVNYVHWYHRCFLSYTELRLSVLIGAQHIGLLDTRCIFGCIHSRRSSFISSQIGI